MSDRVDVLVVGAGLTGLACARALLESAPRLLVVEREAEVGGLCRSISRGGFSFDLTGHVLHMRTEEVQRFVLGLLPDAWERVTRRARIFHDGVLVPYPFQVNLAPLPPHVKRDCLLGLFRAKAMPAPAVLDVTFGEWIRRTFGEGIARHFMLPYNRKMWGVDLEEMSAEWTSFAVPVPTLEEVVDGALGISTKAFGYNPEFLYPSRGGIEVLPRALAEGLPVERDELQSLDLPSRTATFASGRRVAWERLVSTIPLPELVRRSQGLSPDVTALAASLHHVAVVVFNLGVRGCAPTDAHWIYYADAALPFYRVGFPSNFSSGVAPSGTYSMYVELSVVRPPVDTSELRSAVLEGLRAVGILGREQEPVAEAPVVIPYGYVIYDFHRRRAVPILLETLARAGVISTGRYGAWEYGSMETAIAQGLRAAASLR